MSAAKYDLTIPKGEDYSFTLRILDLLDDPVTLVAPYGKAEIREDDHKPLAAAFTIAPLSPPDGTLKFSLTSAQTLALDANKNYKWDFFWFDSAGNRLKLLYGNVKAVANVTRMSSAAPLDFTYTTANSQVTITAYTGTGGAVAIPSSIGGFPVTIIGTDAFADNIAITSVTIPNSVTSIAESAFANCTGLTSATIGSGVTFVGDAAFYGCTSLASINCYTEPAAWATGSAIFTTTTTTLLFRVLISSSWLGAGSQPDQDYEIGPLTEPFLISVTKTLT